MADADLDGRTWISRLLGRPAAAREPDRAGSVVAVADALLGWMDHPAQEQLIDQVADRSGYAEALADLLEPYGVLRDRVTAPDGGIATPRGAADRVAADTVVDLLGTVVELLVQGCDRLPGDRKEQTASYLDHVARDLAALAIPATPPAGEEAPPAEVDGAAALGAEYTVVAATEARQADKLRNQAALLALLLAAAVVGVPLALGHPPLSLEAHVTRISLAVPLGFMIGHLVRESGRRRRAAERNRALGANLRHLPAFVRDLPEKDRHTYRVELGRRAWPPPEPPDPVEKMSIVDELLARLPEAMRSGGDHAKG